MPKPREVKERVSDDIAFLTNAEWLPSKDSVKLKEKARKVEESNELLPIWRPFVQEDLWIKTLERLEEKAKERKAKRSLPLQTNQGLNLIRMSIEHDTSQEMIFRV